MINLSEVASNPYICYVCGFISSVERRKLGKFICNECLKVWEGGKFYYRASETSSPVPTGVGELDRTN